MNSKTNKIMIVIWSLLLLTASVTIPYVHYHEVLQKNTPLLVKSDSTICFYSHSPSIELSVKSEPTTPLAFDSQFFFSKKENPLFLAIHGNLGDRAPPIC